MKFSGRHPPLTSNPSSSLPSPRSSADLVAVIAVDPTGRVLAANSSAQQFWPGETLCGRPLVSLFAFEILSEDPDFLEAQWEATLLSAANRWTPLSARTPGGAAPRPVQVRIEKNHGGTTGYFAVITTAAAAGSADSPPPVETAAPAALPGPEPDAPGDGFRLLAEQGSAGFFDIDLRSGRVLLSPGWKRMLGYEHDELPDTIAAWRRLIHPDDSAAAPDQAGRRAAPGARPISKEYRMQHRRGTWAWVHCFGLQVIGADGQVDRVVGLHLDISERKELEDSLIASDARLQELSGDGPLAAFELDFSTSLVWFSPAWERLLGYEEGELPLRPAALADCLPRDEAGAGATEWLLNRAPGQSVFVEPVTLRRKDGTPLPALLAASRTISRKRELIRVLGFACPLVGSAPARNGGPPAALLQEALNAAAEGVLACDVRGQVLVANATAGRLLEVDAATLPGQSVREVFRLVNRQTRHPVDDPVQTALSAEQPLPLVKTDALAPASEGGSLTPIVWTARPSNGSDGKVLGVVLVFRNPDEMTLTPEELVKANRFEALAMLAGGIAHDFNNLLTTILGAVSLGKDNRDYSALGEAEKACLVAKGLTRQLLAFAKGGTSHRTVCPPKELLEDSVKIAAPDSNAIVTVEVPEGTDNLHVDRAQMLQVFQNLIVNALQAMPPPPHQPRLQIRAAKVAVEAGQFGNLVAGDYVAIEVRDNGSGIKPEYIEKIFDPFFTTKKHGTGLGLATVLSLVRKHGGQLTLDSAVGVGTLFTVYLPKAQKPAEVQARRAPSLRVGTGRVLFMDDDAQISALTATMLQGLEYKYDLAKNGEEAIALYKRYLNIGRPYDAVILDLTIVGGMGGEQCFEELRRLDPDVRAIVSSGYDNEDMARQFLELGFCGYLTKPYRVADLGKTLKAVLG